MKKIIGRIRWWLWHKIGPGPTVIVKEGNVVDGAVIHGGILYKGGVVRNCTINGHGGAGVTWMMVFVLMGLFRITFGQETNVSTLTNTVPVYDPSLFPAGKEAIWLTLVPPVTFTITWMFGKIPKLPKEILPWITPLVGVTIGYVMNWAAAANLPWWFTAGAGAIAVAIYEAAKGLSHAGPQSTLTPNS